MTLTYYLVLAAILFTIGAVGVLVRRNAIVVFMCVELMLNSANLTLVTFARANSVAAPALRPDGALAESSFATGTEVQEVEQMPRPTGRRQLGSPDAALGTTDGTPSGIPGGQHS